MFYIVSIFFSKITSIDVPSPQILFNKHFSHSKFIVIPISTTINIYNKIYFLYFNKKYLTTGYKSEKFAGIKKLAPLAQKNT